MKTNDSEMPLYNECLKLLKRKVTLESLLAWEELDQKARGIEAERVGQLWEALFAAIDEEELDRWNNYNAERMGWD